MAYNWKRFYIPRGESCRIDETGFLLDPEADYAKYYGQPALNVDVVLQKQCVIFLGEPGIGKTHEIEIGKQYETSTLIPQGSSFLSIDLRSIGSEQMLCRKLMDDPEFLKWKNGSHRLYLYLDSFDEGLLRIDVLSSLLQDEFSKLPCDRLFLRIACRTAEWPETLNGALEKIYKAAFGVYELLPLRRKDVQLAAEVEEILASEFINQVTQQNIVAFAVKPVSLKLLLNIYKRGGALPETRSDIYERGCLLLCEETDEEKRRRRQRQNTYSSETLLVVASRIAALTVLCNKDAVFTKTDQGDVPPDDLTLQSICGGYEISGNQHILMSEELVRQSLNTGLFTSRGPYRMGWAHLTYAEFLSARYLKSNRMTSKQIFSLIVHPGDISQRIVPQLQETSSWIANSNTDVMSYLLQHDPEVLLRCDLCNTDTSLKKKLVSSILHLAEEVKINDDSIRDYYHKLKHYCLPIQLRPFLVDKGKHFLARRIAIDIAEACTEENVLPELLAITFNMEEDASARHNAAYAVTRIGDKDAKLKLKHYLTNREDDPDDELKGCALMCLYPDFLSTEELFTFLTRPRKQNLVGSYHTFLYNIEKSLSLKEKDYTYALEWVAKCQWEHEDILIRIKDKIIVEGWKVLLAYSYIAQPFARALYELVKKCANISAGLTEQINRDRPEARIITKAILPYFIDDDHNLYLLTAFIPLVVADDVPWLLEECQNSIPELAALWATMVSFFCKPDSLKYFDLILQAKRSNPILSQKLSFLNPVGIDSPEGRKMKAGYLEHLEFESEIKRRSIRPLLEPSPLIRVQSLLSSFENGNMDAWWKLNTEMTLKPDSVHYRNEFESDLRDLPVWAEADSQLRFRLINAAKSYINNPPMLDDQWIVTDTFNRPYAAGYKAFVLLYNTEPQYVNEISTSIWAQWAAVFIKYPFYTKETEEPHVSLMKLAYLNASEHILDNLSRYIDAENEKRDILCLSQRIIACYDHTMAQLLFQKATSSIMKAKFRHELFEVLFDKGYEPAIEHAKAFLIAGIPDNEEFAKEYVFYAAAIVHYYPNIANQLVWPILFKQEQFGHELIKVVSSERDLRHGKVSCFADNMNEDEVANLYIWIEERYPFKDDPVHNDAYSPDYRDNIADLRNGLLSNLRDRGTFDACKAIEKISSRFPEFDFIKWTLVDTENNARRETWIPPSPQSILSLACDRHKKYVENGAQLLDIVIELLDNLQQMLHGEKPRIEDLWDNRGNAVTVMYCPKEENRFSDYIARYLEDCLVTKAIIVNREVEIRKGQETDIHLVAVNPETQDKIIAIIEVKGCWHTELQTAMQTQLVDRYLKNNQCPNGLYLVGWFLCDTWAGDDYRKRVTPKWPMQKATQFFEDQASGIKSKSDIPRLELRSFVLDTHIVA